MNNSEKLYLNDLKKAEAVPQWSRKYADQILERSKHKDSVTIAAGISLSGPVHVGHLREFMIAIVMQEAITQAGKKANLHFFADDMDPLKKKYDFLPEAYDEFVGVPLHMIPSHISEGVSYSDYFLREFVDSLHNLGVEFTLHVSSEEYKNGKYNEAIGYFLNNLESVDYTLKSVTGSQKKDPLFPLQIICPHCNHTKQVTIHNFTSKACDIHCGYCQHDSSVSYTDNNGKLKWRYDWPARWHLHGIDAEPVAQDHYSKGGSYQSASAILEKHFQSISPVAIPYTWVKDKKSSDLHTTKGAIAATDLIAVYPRSVLWSLYTRTPPHKPIRFEIHDSLIEEYSYLKKHSPGMLSSTMDIQSLLIAIEHQLPHDSTGEEHKKLQEFVKKYKKNEARTIPKEWHFFLNRCIVQLELIENWSESSIIPVIQNLIQSHFDNQKEGYVILNKILYGTVNGPKVSHYISLQKKSEFLDKLRSLLE